LPGWPEASEYSPTVSDDALLLGSMKTLTDRVDPDLAATAGTASAWPAATLPLKGWAAVPPITTYASADAARNDASTAATDNDNPNLLSHVRISGPSVGHFHGHAPG
jgi:hypothetical protein